jgi:hypothetical protein
MPTRPDANTVLICMPIAEQPVPFVPARRGKCSLCGCAVWVSRTSPKTAERYCTPCAFLHLDKDSKFAPLSAAQLAEVKRRRLE